jgi:hypothetical protein
MPSSVYGRHCCQPVLDGEAGDRTADRCAYAQWIHDKRIGTTVHRLREHSLEIG